MKTIEHAAFLHEDMVRFQMALTVVMRQAASAPWKLFVAGVCAVCALPIPFIDAEILYRVFDYVGGDGAIWNSSVMAASGLVAFAAYKLLAHQRPDSPMIRAVERIVAGATVLYMLGVGALVSLIVYARGLKELTVPSDPWTSFTETATADPGAWVDTLMKDFAGPVSGALFSLALAGITVMSIFVMVKLSALAAENFEQGRSLIRTARQASADYKAVRFARSRYAELGDAITGLRGLWTPTFIAERLTDDVLERIARALLPHKKMLKRLEVEASSPLQTDTPNLEAVASSIAAIEAATRRKDVERALLIPTDPETSS